MRSQYSELLRKLYKINSDNPVSLGLNNINLINKFLGYPLDNIPIIHVGGTNGKGSVCFKTAKTLQLSGFKTGLFTSPHLSSFRERIQVDGKILSEEDVTTFLPEIISICDSLNIRATFFEITTALALLKFSRDSCDIAVFEVGLGGRLDSTNIFNSPIISVITSVQLDHMNILGDTIEKIAIEKSGIMKPNCPILVGPNTPIELLRSRAKMATSIFYKYDDIVLRHNSNSIFTAEEINRNLTRALFKIISSNQLSPYSPYVSVLSTKVNEKAIEQGIMARPPCRFEIIKQIINNIEIDVVLDIAHNPDAMENFVKMVKNNYPSYKNIKVVLGMSSDKDIENCIYPLIQIIESLDNVYFVQARNARAISRSNLSNIVENIGLRHGLMKRTKLIEDININSNIRFELRNAMNDASLTSSDPLVLVCGSAFVMAEARAELGIIEPRDSDHLDINIQDAQENFQAK